MRLSKEVFYWVFLTIGGILLGLGCYFLTSIFLQSRLVSRDFISAEDDLSQSAENPLAQPQTLVFMPESPINSFPVPPDNLNISRVSTIKILGGDLSSVPDSVASWAQSPLSYFTISFSGAGRVSEHIGALTSLKTLDLSGNNLTSLPRRISDLQNLTTLNLSYNRLSVLPDSIGMLSNLQVLDIRANNLSVLPDLGQLKNLTHLFLGGNRISREDIVLLQSLLPGTAIFY